MVDDTVVDDTVVGDPVVDDPVVGDPVVEGAVVGGGVAAVAGDDASSLPQPIVAVSSAETVIAMPAHW